nr:hypothetical protein [Tanacetum cinerariifolium]
KVVATARRLEMPLLEVCTAIEEKKKKLPVKDRWGKEPKTLYRITYLQEKRASLVARQIKEETSNTIKLEDLAKLVSHVQPSFTDMDSPKDDHVIVMDDSDEDEEDEFHATKNVKTEYTSVPKSSFLNPHLPELKKNKVEAEAALLKAQPSFPNVGQLNELMVKSLQTNFPMILSAHDFSSSLPTELKDLPSKFMNLRLSYQEAKLTLCLLRGRRTQTKQPSPSFFKDELKRILKKENLNSQQQKPITPPVITIIPPVITTTTTQMQSPPQDLQKGFSQLEGNHIKKDKGKKAMSSKDAKEVSTESDSDDETIHMPSSMVESSKKKELKKFDFVTESGEHVYLTEEHISAQKKIEEEAKAEAAKCKGEIRKQELIDLLGPEVVNKY